MCRSPLCSCPTFADRATCRLVIETLRDAFETEPTRKCFRLVGGVLVERTVADVLPELESQHQQVRLRLLQDKASTD